MRVVKLFNKDAYDLEVRCKLMLHSQKVSEGEVLLIDRGDCLMGPMKVIESHSPYAVLVAESDFNYYHHIDGNDLDLKQLESVFMPEEYYVPVTGNITLDGFLRSAYYDNKGLLHVDLSVKYNSLSGYFEELMNDSGIVYHKTLDGFLIDDDKVVEAVFNSCGPCMPIRYVVGYLASFIALAKISQSSNPKLARYQFSLVDGYMEDDVIIPGFFENSRRGQKLLYSFFASMDPFPMLIDEMESGYESEEIIFERPKLSFRKEALPDVIRLMFYYSGYSPVMLETQPPSMTVRFNASDEKSTVCFIDEDCDEPLPCDYVIRDSVDGVQIGKAGGPGPISYTWLFNNPWFSFGREMSSYFEIIIGKL